MTVRVILDDQVLELKEGTTLAAALMRIGVMGMRRSVDGEWRAPFCGMGTCFECRVTIDGVKHQRSCQIVARDGMEVRRES